MGIVRKTLLVVAVALALSLASASSAQGLLQISKARIAAKLKNNPLAHKAATLGLAALLLMPVVPSEVLAKEVARNPEQVVQLSPDSKVQHGDTEANAQLIKAVRTYDTDLLVAVLASGRADVNATDKDGNTALHHATGDGFFINPDNPKKYFAYEARIKLLLAYGANPNIANNNGFTPYEHVLDEWDAHGEPEGGVNAAAVQKAIYGINHRDKDGSTPLNKAMTLVHYGSYDGDDIVRWLLASGADARGLDLHEAAAFVDREKFLSLVRERGGLRHIVEERGEELLKRAMLYDNEPVVELLLDYGVDPNAGVHSASIEQLEYLLDRGANINFTDKNGRSPLLWYATGVDHNKVEFLLRRGASPNLVDKWGRTALHNALDGCCSGLGATFTSFLMTNMLLEYGDFADLKDSKGMAPYDYAAKDYDSHDVGERLPAAATAAILLKAMVGADGKDAKGRTAVDWAKLTGNKTIQELIAGERTYLYGRELQRVAQELHDEGKKRHQQWRRR